MYIISHFCLDTYQYLKQIYIFDVIDVVTTLLSTFLYTNFQLKNLVYSRDLYTHKRYITKSILKGDNSFFSSQTENTVSDE